ncbi:sugar transferase [Nocardioides sp.]|uniref:sugar transferase n=1 Tax=Nocardioides sp. TaxID=35761 RepID=UPI0035AF1CC2
MKQYDVVKRGIDVLVGGLALIISAPVQAAIAVLIRRELGSPVLFRQPRPGKDGEVFELAKFRTMHAPDPDRGLVTDEQRMTRLGSLLRSTSLDELPTLWSVVKGDMSLVGPRPLLVQYLDRYTPEQARRHEVRPGVTGLAQVSGRNAISWSEKFAKDVEYVDRRSLRLDVWIAWRTISQVVRRDGISADGEATMHEFIGEGRG